MSAQRPTPDAGARGETQVRGRRDLARTGAVAVLVVLATLFAVLNLSQVEVDWIIGSGHAPLIIVIVISLLVGVLLSYAAQRRSRRDR